MVDDKPPPDTGGEGRGVEAPSSDATGLAPWTEQRLLRRTLEARLKAASDSKAREDLQALLSAPKQTRSERRKILSTLLGDDARSVRDALDYVKASKLDEGRLDQGTQIVIHIGVPALAKPKAAPPPLTIAAVPAATNGKPAS